jgi:hypothetical protein
MLGENACNECLEGASAADVNTGQPREASVQSSVKHKPGQHPEPCLCSRSHSAVSPTFIVNSNAICDDFSSDQPPSVQNCCSHTIAPPAAVAFWAHVLQAYQVVDNV